MGRKYRNSIKYIKNRYKKLAKKREKRKTKKYNPLKHQIKGKKFLQKIPKELELFKNFKRDEGGIFKIELPKSFSITNNPIETIRLLKKISNLFYNNNDLDITVICKDTIDMDMSALIMLDLLIVRGSKYLVKKGFKCVINGDFPDDLSTRELFIFSGLPKHLKLLNNNKINYKVEILDPFLFKKDSNLETARIINYYNSCLKKNGYQLNDKGKIYFYKLINEIVDNAKIHNGIKDLYYCGGFYSDTTKKGQLSIISLGNSIYESLNSDSTDALIKKKISEYISCQKKFYDISYKEESSWTVYALQYKISRCNNIDSPDRGTGTIRFIEAFMQMGNTVNDENPKMSLMSGNTHILFDGKYNLKEKEVNGEKIKVIAFNENNNLKEKPDSDYVKNIPEKFPGVIINLEFFVDKEYLTRFKEDQR